MERQDKSFQGNPQIPKLLTVHDVATILNVSRSHAYVLMQSGQIPTIRLGRSVRVRPKDLEEYILLNVRGGNNRL